MCMHLYVRVYTFIARLEHRDNSRKSKHQPNVESETEIDHLDNRDSNDDNRRNNNIIIVS